MTGEQLMVVDSQPQTIVVDQQQIAYQQGSPQQHFIIQETDVDQQQTRQVYYMQESMQETGGHTETTTETPIVLNHQMQHGQLRNQIVSQKITVQPQMGQQQGRPSTGVAQVRQQLQVYFLIYLVRSKNITSNLVVVQSSECGFL